MDTASERFWTRVAGGDFTECWLWAGPMLHDGYGRFTFHGNENRAHRFAYECMVGEIPEQLVLDHLCRVRACVNPWHLEPVTLGVNSLRGEGWCAQRARATACIHGHPFDETNTNTANGRRQCRACNAVAVRRYKQRRREQVLA